MYSWKIKNLCAEHLNVLKISAIHLVKSSPSTISSLTAILPKSLKCKMALGVTQGSHTRNKTEWEFPGDGRREEWEVRKGGWRQPQHSCVNGLHAT